MSQTSAVEKVLLDTDIGTDIDDAVCLAYLLANPRCELLGITTVSGEALQRARMASVLCRIAEQDVPIFPGREKPLVRGRWYQPRAPQAEKLDRWPHQHDFPSGQAVAHMSRTIRENPGEVSLLAIGAMTNVAALFAADPEAASLLKRLVLMCGVFTNRLPKVGPLEWNAIQDRTATAIVYEQQVAVHRSIGLDVTCQVTLPKDEVRERFRTPLLEPVLDFAEVWFDGGSDLIVFHDPLAATTLFDDAICGFRRGKVRVELESQTVPGMTHFERDEEGPHEVALKVEPQRFFEHFFAQFS